MLFKKLLTLIFLTIFALSFTSSAKAATFEEEVVSLINSERQQEGLSALNYSENLFQASKNHNDTMFECSKTHDVNSCFKHQVTLLNEESLLPRIQDTGYNPQAVSENIAWGHQTPESVVVAWMGSSGHRANILGNYKDVGCDYLDALNGSYQGKYWTCDFGRSFGSSANPTPTPTRVLTPTKTPTPSPTIRPSSPQPTAIIPTKTPTPTIRITNPTRVPTATPTKTPTPTISQSFPKPTSGQTGQGRNYVNNSGRIHIKIYNLDLEVINPFAAKSVDKPWWCKYFDTKSCS